MKLAFVTPWYGRDIPGGSEAEARRTAGHLHRAGYDVEVLTTTIRDLYADWSTNDHAPGTSVEEGIPVHRFPVEKRDKQAFDSLNRRLMEGRLISPAEEEVFNREMFRSPELYATIGQRQGDTLFFFIPYMFPTTYIGAQICPQRSVMIPCLHDEAYARLDIHQHVIPQVKALLLHSEAEKALADALYPPQADQLRVVVGEGVDTGWQGEGARFRQKYGLGKTPFVLYAGRREPGKNTPLLIRYWQAYARETEGAVKMVLIGPGRVSLPADENIVDLGFVSVQDKYDAYAAADVFCLPSVNESFSLVVMESWLAGTPVLVHGHCAVTREHCVKSNGGLYFTSYAEFAATLNYLLDHPQTAARMGENGRRYVLANFRWPLIIEKYGRLIRKIEAAVA